MYFKEINKSYIEISKNSYKQKQTNSMLLFCLLLITSNNNCMFFFKMFNQTSLFRFSNSFYAEYFLKRIYMSIILLFINCQKIFNKLYNRIMWCTNKFLNYFSTSRIFKNNFYQTT